MMKDLCEIVVVLDRSGSMDRIRSDVVGGFNSFVEDQKKVAGDANITLIQFDDQSIDTLYDSVLLTEVDSFEEDDFHPRGATPLLDAVGKTIDEMGERLDAILDDEKPDKVLIAILTDGLENASNKYTRNQIFEMINHQRNTYGWEFVFLAANQDAIAEGATLGIMSKNSINFDATSKGTRGAYRSMTNVTTSYRTSK